MTSKDALQRSLIAWIAILCCLLLVVGVIWSSDRALEFTDEAYYILSAIHPEQVLLYISAQHWVLAPLWSLTENLQGFRLTGAAILLATSGILGLGAARTLGQLTERKLPLLETLGVVAAGGVGALLYVATIAPSPSYNLLASAGAYAAAGFTLLAVRQRSLLASVSLCLVAGLFLAVCFVNKPSAGICSALVVLILTIALQPGARKWLLIPAGFSGVTLMLTFLVFVQPSEMPVQDSLFKGLELFRMVQTEPVEVRLIRYAKTLLVSIGGMLVSFWPVVVLTVASLFYPRRWLAILTLCTLALILIVERNYLAGSSSYQRMMEGVYGINLLLLLSGFRLWVSRFKVTIFFAALMILPFSVAIGTGNSLFTQVIVTLAPWTVLAVLLTFMISKDETRSLLQKGMASILLILITTQIFTSYVRDPYHLSRPLIEQTQLVSVATLGELRVDRPTDHFLEEVRRAKDLCAIEPGAQFLGLFNVPGLALLFGAIPPVTPWLNNPRQAETVLKFWAPETAERVVVVLTREVSANPTILPRRVQPVANGYMFCGDAQMPFQRHDIEIWASKIKAPV